MLLSLDNNVLAYAVEAVDPDQDYARYRMHRYSAALMERMTNDDSLIDFMITAPVIAEFVSVNRQFKQREAFVALLEEYDFVRDVHSQAALLAGQICRALKDEGLIGGNRQDREWVNFDALIAATTITHGGYIICTYNVRDFEKINKGLVALERTKLRIMTPEDVTGPIPGVEGLQTTLP